MNDTASLIAALENAPGIIISLIREVLRLCCKKCVLIHNQISLPSLFYSEPLS